MKRTAAIFALAAVAAGCASSNGNSSVSLGTGSPDFTLQCPAGLSECHQRAREYCGDAGYRVERRPGDTGYTTAGTGDARTEELLGRTSRRTASQTSMTVSCKAPKPGE